MNLDLRQIERVAVGAAYRAGKILNGHFGNLTHISKKGAIDLVTAADIESEQAILATIRDAFPGHGVLAEESGLINESSQDRWIIDPLDGTTNFAHNLPIFAASIAYAHNGQVQVGVVFNPSSGELFSAMRGAGARLNGRPIQVSAAACLQDSLLVTGFPYQLNDIREILMRRFDTCLAAAQGVRRLGSAALDLCYVACGRFEGFWESRLKPWDTAAGALIAMEAGGRVTDFSGADYEINGVEILATNGYIHPEMISKLKIEDL